MAGSNRERIPTNLRAMLILEAIGRAAEPLSAADIGRLVGLPKQTAHRLYNTLVEFCQTRQKAAFQEIKTPLLYMKTLWEQSGHWGKYRENMFLVLDNESGEHDMSLKPMNCPSHYLYYASQTHSYRELPIIAKDGSSSRVSAVYQAPQRNSFIIICNLRMAHRAKNHMFVGPIRMLSCQAGQHPTWS